MSGDPKSALRLMFLFDKKLDDDESAAVDACIRDGRYDMARARALLQERHPEISARLSLAREP